MSFEILGCDLRNWLFACATNRAPTRDFGAWGTRLFAAIFGVRAGEFGAILHEDAGLKPHRYEGFRIFASNALARLGLVGRRALWLAVGRLGLR